MGDLNRVRFCLGGRNCSVLHHSCPFSATRKGLCNRARHSFQLLAQAVSAENVCFGSGGRRQRLLSPRSLRTRSSEVFASAFYLLSRARSFVALAFGPANKHSADVSFLSPVVVVAGYFRIGAGVWPKKHAKRRRETLSEGGGKRMRETLG